MVDAGRRRRATMSASAYALMALALVSNVGAQQPLFSCDFEAGDLCGMQQSGGDQRDWNLFQGTTPSGSTGPSADHTRGDNQGYYVYLETSSPVAVGDQAILVLDDSALQTPPGARVLSFWYHMWGSSVGSLTVVATDSSGSQTTLFDRSGEVADDWRQAQANLPANTVTVTFTATKGGNNDDDIQGDIALDDIAVARGQQGQPPTPAPPPGGTVVTQCNFENNDICDLEQVTDGSDDFDWEVNQGQTASQGTGPAVDSTTGTDQGRYAYIEVSNPRNVGEEAFFATASGAFDNVRGPYRLTFAYHMFGDSTGSLTVRIEGSFGQRDAFTQTGQVSIDSFDWRQADVNLPPGTTRVIFIADKSVDEVKGDIAIDDVVITAQTPAPGQGGVVTQCDFEANNVCDLVQLIDGVEDNFDWSVNQGSTGSGRTGPRVDRTTGTQQGRYAYIEVSDPRAVGDVARLATAQGAFNNFRGPYRLTFGYHMYGSSIGTLTVRAEGSFGESDVFTQTGQVSVDEVDWRQADVNLPDGTTRVIFIADKSVDDVRGDIAIDDVVFAAQGGGGVTPAPTAAPTAGPTAAPTPAPGGGVVTQCDFEADNVCDLVQLTNGVEDNFDWSVNQGPTGSGTTGPRVDSTTSTDQGRYAYIEVSDPRSVGDVARLATALGAFNNFRGPYRLTFAYHMYGSSIGTLTVRAEGSFGGRDVFVQTGQVSVDEVDWRQADVNLPDGTTRVIFIADKSVDDVRGDIAIDDVVFAAPTPAPGGGVVTHCDFEADNVCDLVQLTDGVEDNFDWSVNQGPTGSGRTGPRVDSTTSTDQGRYAYIEVSDPRSVGDVARLATALGAFNNFRGPYRLTFAYHMYGSSIGTLTVRAEGSFGGRDVFVQTGQVSVDEVDWRQADVNLPDGTTRVIFIADKSVDDVRGDIAIDDVVFAAQGGGGVTPAPTAAPTAGPTAAPTPAPGGGVVTQCDFEADNVCNLVQLTDGVEDNFDWSVNQGPTGSGSTGPRVDSTTSTDQGRYAYIEVSDPRSVGDVARLATAQGAFNNFRGPYRLTFAYHMYGGGIGTLTVRAEGSFGESDVFVQTGQVSVDEVDWRQADVNLPDGTTRVIFIADKSIDDVRGDIAIDDVVIAAQGGGGVTPAPTPGPTAGPTVGPGQGTGNQGNPFPGYVACDKEGARCFSATGSGGPVVGGPGVAGPVGPAGPIGPTGPEGSPGPLGRPGPSGRPGETGARGVTGSNGGPGPQGPSGRQGSPGPFGPTGASGGPGPRGDPGPSGRTGATGGRGEVGPRGLPGSVGDPGPLGPSGREGRTGASGRQGPSGPAGVAGRAGPAGPSGPIGPSGPQGSVGATGDRGNLGPSGPVGGPGARGPAGNPGPSGPTGSPGPSGPSGLPGRQGERGPSGPTGPAGPTGPEGPEGRLGASGATGPSGPSGPTGPSGPSGPQGPTGSPGPQGPSGLQGQAGARGNEGPEGRPGSTGATGGPGPAGRQGNTGSTGPGGPTGPRGVPGPGGPVGATGIPGLTGSTGIRGPSGPSGPSGNPGPRGPAGSPGTVGAMGPEGPAGPRGTPGVAGAQGSQGDPGQAGPQGIQGEGGLPGPQGRQGSPGTAGATGPSGPIGFTGPSGPAGSQGPRGVPGNDGRDGGRGLPGLGITVLNECTINNGGCSQICVDTYDGYCCMCDTGYTLIPLDQFNCTIDRLVCSQTMEAGYQCRCRIADNSFIPLNGTDCINVNECDTNNGFCSQNCFDNVGSYSCGCNSGFQLGIDGFICEDVDECSNNRCNFDETCVNTYGSFLCLPGRNAAQAAGYVGGVAAGAATGTVSVGTGVVIAVTAACATALLFLVGFLMVRTIRRSRARKYGGVRSAHDSSAGSKSAHAHRFASRFNTSREGWFDTIRSMTTMSEDSNDHELGEDNMAASTDETRT